MDDDILRRLMTVLEQLGYGGDNVHLEFTDAGNVGGHVVSEAFLGESQVNRQNKLWHELGERLPPADLARIVAILTVTPEEIGEDD